MNLLNNIKQLCDNNSITLAKLEKDLNFGNGTLSRWDTSSPSVDKIQKVANYFFVTIDELINNQLHKNNNLCLYDKIEQLCKSKNSNVSNMCKDLGLSPSTLSELKAGRSETLSIKTLTKIANYFEITIGYLIGEKNTSVVYITSDKTLELQKYIERLKEHPDLIYIFNLLNSANKKDINKIIKIIQIILE